MNLEKANHDIVAFKSSASTSFPKFTDALDRIETRVASLGNHVNKAKKLIPCRFYMRGQCTKGDHCTFFLDGDESPSVKDGLKAADSLHTPLPACWEIMPADAKAKIRRMDARNLASIQKMKSLSLQFSPLSISATETTVTLVLVQELAIEKPSSGWPPSGTARTPDSIPMVPTRRSQHKNSLASVSPDFLPTFNIEKALACIFEEDDGTPDDRLKVKVGSTRLSTRVSTVHCFDIPEQFDLSENPAIAVCTWT